MLPRPMNGKMTLYFNSFLKQRKIEMLILNKLQQLRYIQCGIFRLNLFLILCSMTVTWNWKKSEIGMLYMLSRNSQPKGINKRKHSGPAMGSQCNSQADVNSYAQHLRGRKNVKKHIRINSSSLEIPRSSSQMINNGEII